MELINVNQKRLPMPLDSGILYTVVAIYYTYVSKMLAGFVSRTFANSGHNTGIILILSEVLFFAVPPLILAYIRRYDIKKTFRLKAPKPLEALVVLLISPVMVIAGFCSGIIAIMAVKSIFGRVYLAGDVTDVMTKGVLISLFLVAVVPAVCEEFLFRGMIQRGIERLGAGWSIFLSGLLFGLFHFDFQRLAAQTLIGFIAAYVVYRTGSIFNGMILHFMNNGLLTLLANYSIKTQEQGTKIITDPFDTPEFMELAKQYNMTLEQLMGAAAIVLSILLIASLIVVFGLLIVIRAITRQSVEKPEKIRGSAKGLLIGIPGLALIVVVYLSLGLMLLNNELGTRILRLIGIA